VRTLGFRKEKKGEGMANFWKVSKEQNSKANPTTSNAIQWCKGEEEINNLRSTCAPQYKRGRHVQLLESIKRTNVKSKSNHL